MTDECDMDMCKLENFLFAKRMSAMLVNAVGLRNDIIVPDLEAIGENLSSLERRCELKDEDKKELNETYRELISTFPQSGPKLAASLAGLMEKVALSHSNCKCYK